MKKKAQKKPKAPDLGKQAQAAMRQHGITLGTFGDRRIIYNDHNAPERALDLVRRALKQGLI